MPALSPRSWGWTAMEVVRRVPAPVVPTLVGVDRNGCEACRLNTPLSPRSWGWTGMFYVLANTFFMSCTLRSGYIVPARRTCRSTPTSVGTTRRIQATRFTAISVHPHERGDNRSGHSPYDLHSGPPPRAWGQRRHDADVGRSLRSHPHERGDNGLELLGRGVRLGPPPRAWGQRR